MTGSNNCENKNFKERFRLLYKEELNKKLQKYIKIYNFIQVLEFKPPTEFAYRNC